MPKSKNIISFFKIFYSIITIAMIFVIISISISWANSKNTLKQKSITLNGAKVLSDKNYVLYISEKTSANIHDLSAKEILETIISHPFVQASRISYRYPNKLVIDIKEREPFAILNKDPMVILDKNCFVLPDTQILRNYDVPILSKFNSDNNLYNYGEKALSVKVQETISWLSSLHENYPDFYSNISEIFIENGNEIVIILDDYPTKILLGDKNTMHKIEILKRFEQTIERTKKITDYAYLDIRYNNQVIAKEKM